ncbi:MAG: hypothetical protein JXR94_05300, partial [Candidatus Hydrogenedentes bacterium]|nr:hypothetical protein [Candidatus Hydrogenedentota bacterium]
WYMDQQGDWFHDAALMGELARLKGWGDASMALPRESVAEVAVISSLESEFYLCGRDSGRNRVTGPLYVAQIGELCRTGAPFDWFLIEDLAEGLVPPHKAYVFLDCFYLTPGQRAAIEALKTDGRALIWFYAPGYIGHDALSLDGMEGLTGMTFSQREQGTLAARLGADKTESAPIFGPNAAQSPVFVPTGDGLDIRARYTDTGQPAVVCRDMGAWRSVYSGVPGVPAAELRGIFAQAGVHIYCDSGDNLSANASWLALHTVEAGRKSIRLPQACSVYDIVNDREIGRGVAAFSVELPADATAIYKLEPAAP